MISELAEREVRYVHARQRGMAQVEHRHRCPRPFTVAAAVAAVSVACHGKEIGRYHLVRIRQRQIVSAAAREEIASLNPLRVESRVQVLDDETVERSR